MNEYAKNTKVSIEDSYSEIQKMLRKYGANRFMVDWGDGFMVFEYQNKPIKIKMPELNIKDFEYTDAGRKRSILNQESAFEQAKKAIWRQLFISIKGKLISIDAGLFTFEDEFLSYYVLKNRKTIGEHILPQLKDNPDFLPRLSNGE